MQGRQSRNKIAKKALGLYILIVLNEICNILLVKKSWTTILRTSRWKWCGYRQFLFNSTPLHHFTLTGQFSWVPMPIPRLMVLLPSAGQIITTITTLGISIQAHGKRQLKLQFALSFCFQVHNPNIKRLSVSTPKHSLSIHTHDTICLHCSTTSHLKNTVLWFNIKVWTHIESKSTSDSLKLGITVLQEK
jgi:hypothetical protein